MTSPTLEVMESARSEIRKHIVQIAKEILEWRATGRLTDGKLREIARTINPVLDHYDIKVVEHLASNIAFEVLIDTGERRQ